jgi:hypothetical protein
VKLNISPSLKADVAICVCDTMAPPSKYMLTGVMEIAILNSAKEIAVITLVDQLKNNGGIDITSGRHNQVLLGITHGIDIRQLAEIVAKGIEDAGCSVILLINGEKVEKSEVIDRPNEKNPKSTFVLKENTDSIQENEIVFGEKHLRVFVDQYLFQQVNYDASLNFGDFCDRHLGWEIRLGYHVNDINLLTSVGIILGNSECQESIFLERTTFPSYIIDSKLSVEAICDWVRLLINQVLSSASISD